jgi:hypothetical protein
LSTFPDCCFVIIAKKKSATLSNLLVTDADGLLVDVDVQSIDDSVPSMCEDKQQDVDNFFHATIVQEIKGKLKKYCTCKLCL